MKKLLFICLAFFLILSSCVFSSEEENRAEKGIYPDLILENATYIVGQKDETPIQIKGEKITLYGKEDRAEVEKIEFYQKEDNAIKIEGSANKAVVNTSTKVLSLEGDVKLKKISDNMEIEARNVEFDSQEEIVSATGKVKVKNKNGEFIGEGFKGDLKSNYYTFESIDEGKIK